MTPIQPSQPHVCLVPACDRQIERHFLMCAPHWKLLPSDMSNTLYFAYAAMKVPQRKIYESIVKGRFDRAKQQALAYIANPQE